MSVPTRRTILIIDDQREHLLMQSLILKEAGFRPITAVAGGQSLSFPDHERPDLIFLDYRLNSSINSQQVVALLRQRYQGTPIVLLSSMPEMPEDMARLVDGFLTKGDPEELVAFTRKFLEPGDQSAAG